MNMKGSTNFFVTEMPHWETEEELYAANHAIKEALRERVRVMESARNNRMIDMRKRLIELEKKRLADEVEEMLADEQRSFEMGQWS